MLQVNQNKSIKNCLNLLTFQKENEMSKVTIIINGDNGWYKGRQCRWKIITVLQVLVKECGNERMSIVTYSVIFFVNDHNIDRFYRPHTLKCYIIIQLGQYFQTSYFIQKLFHFQTKIESKLQRKNSLPKAQG